MKNRYDKAKQLVPPSLWGIMDEFKRFHDAGTLDREEALVKLLWAYKARWQGLEKKHRERRDHGFARGYRAQLLAVNALLAAIKNKEHVEM